MKLIVFKKKEMDEKKQIRTRPSLSAEEVEKVFVKEIGDQVKKVSPLPSYDDQNWKIETNGKGCYILKVSYAEEKEGWEKQKI